MSAANKKEAKHRNSPSHLTIPTGVVVFVLACAGVAWANGGGILNSAHDFSSSSQPASAWNLSGQICYSCHAPHDFGHDKYESGLHWNHTTSNATYSTYVTSDGLAAPQPSGSSKLCLGCHDGTIAIDDFDGSTSSRNTYLSEYRDEFQIPGRLDRGQNLGRTHPVGVEYSYDPSDPDGLHSPTEPMGFSVSINDVLDNGKVVCSSCHDVHNNVSLEAANLLRAPMTVSQGSASGLCLSCHKK